MKIMSILVAFVLLFVFVAFDTSGSDISSTKHNLGSGGTLADKSTDSSEVCVFCHTPHQASISYTPLWNHVTNTTIYAVYTSPSFNATETILPIDTGVFNASLQCMSCHDGTVGVNELYNPPNELGANPTMGATLTELDAVGRILNTRPAYLGVNLVDDHPVNFSYTNSYNEEGPTNLHLNAFVSNLISRTAGYVQCASCHNVHDDTYGSFLRTSMSNSALCLTCHNK